MTELGRRTNNDRRQAEDNLKWLEGTTGFGAYVGPNIRTDRFLPKDAANAIIDFFINLNRLDSINKIRTDYKSICNSFAVTADPIETYPLPQKVGRIAEKRSFINNIATLNAISFTRAERIFWKLEHGSLDAIEEQTLRNCLMSEYGVWVTWDSESDGRLHPFEFSPRRCATEIRASLGLKVPKALLPTEVYAIIYDPLSVSPLRKPTVADAADHLNFATPPEPPPQSHNWHGLTRPWPHMTGSDDDENLYTPLKRRPEAVHKKGCRFPVGTNVETYKNRHPGIS